MTADVAPARATSATALLRAIWSGLDGPDDAPSRVTFEGEGSLPSVFAVSDLAAAAVGAATLAVSELAGPARPSVRVD